MDRRRFIVSAIAGLFGLPPQIVEPVDRIYRLGFLVPGSLPAPGSPSKPLFEALSTMLRQLGWIEGKNLVIEWRAAAEDPKRLSLLAAELVRLNVDLILVGSCGATLEAARHATRTIPIVAATCNDDLVASQVVSSLARPGGNITAQSKVTPELAAKRLSILKEVFPRASRVGVVWNPAYSQFAADWRRLRDVAPTLGVTLHPVEVGSPSDFDAAFARLRRENAEAFLMFSDLIGFWHAQPLAASAARSGLPAIYAFREATDAGGLMSYGPSLQDMFRRAALYIDRILKGTKPGDLPIQEPTTFEFIINLKTAKALGLTIPPSLLARADQVIE